MILLLSAELADSPLSLSLCAQYMLCRNRYKVPSDTEEKKYVYIYRKIPLEWFLVSPTEYSFYILPIYAISIGIFMKIILRNEKDIKKSERTNKTCVWCTHNLC